MGGICTFLGASCSFLCRNIVESQKKQLNPLQVVSGVRSDCVAVVTVVWPVTGSALGPVEWLKALNTEYGLYQPCCLCEKQDLIFLWT